MKNPSFADTPPQPEFRGVAEVQRYIGDLVDTYDWESHVVYAYNPPVIAEVRTTVGEQEQEVEVRLVLDCYSASTDDLEYNYRIIPGIDIGLSDPPKGRVKLQSISGPAVFKQVGIGGLENDSMCWEDEKYYLGVYAERALNPDLHGGVRRAGQLTFPILGAENTDTVLHQSAVPGLSIASTFKRLRNAYKNGWLTAQETGQIAGILYASARHGARSLITDHHLRQGAPDHGNINGDPQTAVASMYDLKSARDLEDPSDLAGLVGLAPNDTGQAPDLDEILRAALEDETRILDYHWKEAISTLHTNIDGFEQASLDEVQNYSPEQRYALVRRMEEAMTQVALLRAGVDHPTVEDARKIIRVKDWLISTAPTLSYPKKSDNPDTADSADDPAA